MPVRLRIIFLFTLLVFSILGIVCASIYYFSRQARQENITRRLTNRAITTARLLSKSEIFDRQLVEHIDSLTTISLKDKSVQAFNYLNQTIYSYSDDPGDTLHVTPEILNEARVNQRVFFTEGTKEAVAYHYSAANARITVVCAAEDEEGKKSLASLGNILMLSFISGIAFTILVGYFFSGRLLRPITRISDEVEEITAQNLTKRIPTGASEDEWHKLSSTLNDLLDRLQESFELQRRFISNASHELSTPLTSISSQLEIALQRERANEHYRSVMSSVLEDVRHMNKLTQTLLEFAKASGDKGGLHIHQFRIDELVMHLPASVRKLQPEFDVSLRFNDFPETESELLFHGNEELLFTALKNIVVNACKYSTNHHADIQLSVSNNSFRIDIGNIGPGIPDADLQHIFQPFYRGSHEQDTSNGFGLGLPLAWRIVRLHKGNIEVKSVPGEQTTFTVVLPAL
ncbi:HAMP domain-containing sensor histidine kinase [Pollutibacter soli]|uniref:HAMP domain-containing sensor histidine kinase n=1 Tax=Pollutibacter soli TaxID=3034157 RepID=UPI00301371F6